MLGAVFGDIVGSAYEWNNVKTKDFPLQRRETRYTDDSVMTLAVAKWLLEDPSRSESHLIKCMQLLGRKHFNAGYGGRFRAWLTTDNPQPYNSWGNGSAMRVSPVALFANSLEEALELARITANVTHNHPEGVKGAMAVAECIYRCLVATDIDAAKQEIRDVIPHKYGYNLSRTLDEIRPNYQFYVSCQGSVPEAIIAFLESDSLEDCARNAISIGGDSDTIAAIACSIYAVKNNLEDETLAKEFERYLSPDLLSIMEDFEKMVAGIKDEETKQMIYEYYKERQDFLNELINNEPINETFKYKRFKTSEEKYKTIVDYFIMLVNEEQLYEFTPYMFKQFKIALSELKKIVLNKDSNNLRNIRITYSEGCKLLKYITKTSIIL